MSDKQVSFGRQNLSGRMEAQQRKQAAEKRKINLVQLLYLISCGIIIAGGILCYILSLGTPDSAAQRPASGFGFSRISLSVTDECILMCSAGIVGIVLGRKRQRTLPGIIVGACAGIAWFSTIMGIVASRSSMSPAILVVGIVCTLIFIGVSAWKNIIMPSAPKTGEEAEY